MCESVYCIGWVDGDKEGNTCCMLLLDIGRLLSCYLILLDIGHSI